MAAERSEFAAGLRAGSQLLVAVAPFGLVTGVAMGAAGIPALHAMAMSVFVYAGASMLAAAQLVAEGAPALLVVLAALFVNLRLLMYSASIRQYFRGETLARRVVVSYFLVDNAYALFVNRFSARPSAPGRFEYFWGVSIPVWSAWQATVAAGLAAGARLPAAWKLEFAAPLAFIAMSVPLLRDRAMGAAAASAALVAVLGHALPLRLGLALAAVAGIAAGMIVERAAGGPR